jgi:hypothetical protein
MNDGIPHSPAPFFVQGRKILEQRGGQKRLKGKRGTMPVFPRGRAIL